MRSFEKIKEDTVEYFKKTFPGEHVTKTVFSEWILNLYCELLEQHEYYREFNKHIKRH